MHRAKTNKKNLGEDLEVSQFLFFSVGNEDS